MYTQHIPTYARFQWLNHQAVNNILTRFLPPPAVGRKGYDKVWMFRWLMYKQLLGCSYRDLESLTGIDYSTFIKFRKRLIATNWFARVFKQLTSLIAQHVPALSLILDSSFVATYSGRREAGAEYSGYYEETGFKLHQIIDCQTRLPLRQTVTPGARADVVWGATLIRAAPRSWRVSSLVADRGYDSSALINLVKHKWRRVQVGIPIRRTTQKLTPPLRPEDTLNYRLTAQDRILTPKLLNTRSEIERYFSRKKRVLNLGEERTRHLQNFRANCHLTSIMEILEFAGTPAPWFYYSPNSYYVYVLKSKKDGKLYIGFTTDLEARIQKHNDGEVFSTKGRRPFELIYYEGYKSLVDARRREKNLKLFSKSYYALRRRLIDSL